MKIKGKTVSPNVEYIVLPRPGENIVLVARPVKDFSILDNILPEPRPPKHVRPGGVPTENRNDKTYQVAVEQYNQKRVIWILLESLNQPENEIVWERVKPDDPNTWLEWERELKESGFTQPEIMHILNGCMAANSLNQERIDAARNDFLRQLAQENVNV